MIEEGDIATYLKSGELHPLLCAIAELTGDRTLLAPEFRPRLTLEAIKVPRNGGLDAETESEARRRAFRALTDYLENGAHLPNSGIPIDDLLEFLTAGDDRGYRDLLRHELGGLEENADWNKIAIDPERPMRAAIIGAGPSGLAMAFHLAQAGIDYVVYDRYEDIGGTWWINTYPGCRLDTNNFAYSFSFAQSAGWRHHYTLQGDLLEYYQGFAQRARLRDHVVLGTEVVSATWCEDEAQWEITLRDVTTGTERIDRVNVLISAVGVLDQPQIPELPGADAYKNDQVHSARWSSDVDFQGRRVSIIGTGASAFQIAPAIREQVAELNIFQRSAPWMLPEPEYHAELDSGVRWLLATVPNYHRWVRLWQFWHSTIGKYELVKADAEWTSEDSVSEANQRFRDALIAHIKSQYVGREDLLPKVIPAYPVGAKRMLRDNGVWAATVQSDNVKLVTDGIERLDESGIHTADGSYYPTDLLIYATGFNATNYLGTINVRGRGGVQLSDFWGDESRAYLGVSIPNFPNLFCLSGPNTALVAIGSQIFMTECAVHYTMQSIRFLLEKGGDAVEPTQEAYDEYIEWMDAGNRAMAWGADGVQSWYRNSRGAVTASWPYPLLTYYDRTREVDPAAVLMSSRTAQRVG